MTRIRPAVQRLSELELQDANKKFPQFHSLHEGYAVLLEELDEAKEEMSTLQVYQERLWPLVRTGNAQLAREFSSRIRETAVDLAVEAIQAAAMAQKICDGLDLQSSSQKSKPDSF